MVKSIVVLENVAYEMDKAYNRLLNELGDRTEKVYESMEKVIDKDYKGTYFDEYKKSILEVWKNLPNLEINVKGVQAKIKALGDAYRENDAACEAGFKDISEAGSVTYVNVIDDVLDIFCMISSLYGMLDDLDRIPRNSSEASRG
jgi:predicted nucleotide-binding protein (sugar kinase/HSP70/actin superfamily)